jgi:prepilin peptidase CpaA
MMAHSIWLRLTPLFVLLLAAALIDARQRRIPNWLTGALALTGLLQSFTPIHACPVWASFAGLFAGFALMVGQFAVGGLGGGDVKLLMGLGTWVGPLPLLVVFAGASLIGLAIVLIQATWQGRMRQLLHNSALLAVNLVHLREVGVAHAQATGKSCRSIDRPLPYAVPVLIATVMVVALPSVIGA